MTRKSASRNRPELSAASTISGPMPAQSPSVIPMRGLPVVMAFESAQLIMTEAMSKSTRNSPAGAESVGLDVSLGTETGQPAFLKILRFLLDQDLFDLRADLVQRFGVAAALTFNF